MRKTRFVVDELKPFDCAEASNIWHLDIAKWRTMQDYAYSHRWADDCKCAIVYWFANAGGYVEPGCEKLVAKAIKHFARVVRMNAFEVVEVMESKRHFSAKEKLPQKKGLTTVETGLALYTGASLFNHACLPNAREFFVDGGGIVVVATDLIKPDEEICISYAGCSIKSEAERLIENVYFRVF